MLAKPADPAFQEYLDTIRRNVCTVCLDGRDDRSCGLSGRVCAIDSHLPGIVRALSSVESQRMEDYEVAIRAHVCSECIEQDAAGRCGLRDKGNCALDAYLTLVLDAVEEVNLQRLARSATT
jgi:hypothetical protein